MNNIQTRAVELVKPVNVPTEQYQYYPSVAWDKKSKTDQVEAAEVVELITTTRVHITPAIYSLAFERLMSKVEEQDYASGSVIFDFGGYECHFEFSIFAYRRSESYPEGTVEEIYDLVPTWWEFHTLKDGEEFLNDFSFAEFKKYL